VVWVFAPEMFAHEMRVVKLAAKPTVISIPP
jgi:hypothetical protein